MRRLICVPFVLFCLATSAVAEDGSWQVGDSVMANFRDEGRWFSAVIVEALGGDEPTYRVVYQDGYAEERGAKVIQADTLRPGCKVDAPREGGYQPATVQRRLGNVALLAFGDDTMGWRGVGQIGVKTEHLQEASGESAEPGKTILAKWKDDPAWYYPGQVVETGEQGSQVVFEDGSRAWRTDAQISDRQLQPGDAVQIKLPGEQGYTVATLETIVGGYAVRVTREDGTVVWTSLSRLRVTAV